MENADKSASFIERKRSWHTLRRFLRHKAAVVSSIFMLVVILASFPLASIVAPRGPYKIDLKVASQPPSATYILGADAIGRDVWSRTIYGGRVSIAVGLVAVAIYIAIGTLLGLISGYYGGRIDSVVMRITDTFMAFPTFIILICVVTLIGPGLVNGMVAIGLLGWTGTARLVRSVILSLREQDFVMAARSVGVPTRRVLFRHILPNVVALLTVSASFGVAGTILTEAGLSFMGLGIRPPTPSWGNMINEAQSIQILATMPWLWIPPGVMITLCVLAINFIGDGLRDALDPRMSLT
jgi:peptide/nickel transport system permease protein